jgi:hypothetical protein
MRGKPITWSFHDLKEDAKNRYAVEGRRRQ